MTSSDGVSVQRELALLAENMSQSSLRRRTDSSDSTSIERVTAVKNRLRELERAESSAGGEEALASILDQTAFPKILGSPADATAKTPEPAEPDSAWKGNLTEREKDVARYLLQGMTYREVGAQMYISPTTVAHHIARIRKRLEAQSHSEMLTKLRATDLSADPLTLMRSSNAKTTSLETTVAAAVLGDMDAYDSVLQMIRPIVLRYCRARVGAGERGELSADDVAQEVCLAVMTALPRYEDQGRPFMAFVYQIASHIVADAHRRSSRNKSEPMAAVPDASSTWDGPDQRVLDSEAGRRLNELLSTLSDRHREILVLRLVVGLSAEETAAAVGSTAGAVRVAQHRAIAKIKAGVTEKDGIGPTHDRIAGANQDQDRLDKIVRTEDQITDAVLWAFLSSSYELGRK